MIIRLAGLWIIQKLKLDLPEVVPQLWLNKNTVFGSINNKFLNYSYLKLKRPQFFYEIGGWFFNLCYLTRDLQQIFKPTCWSKTNSKSLMVSVAAPTLKYLINEYTRLIIAMFCSYLLSKLGAPHHNS